MRFPTRITLPKWREGKLDFMGVAYDTRFGAGATIEQHEIDYFGFIAIMKASQFLRLAAKLNTPNEESLTFLREAIREGSRLGVMQLNLDVKNRKIVSHEGRHRAMSIMQEMGDIYLPVAIKPGVLRASNIPESIINLFMEAVYSEDGKIIANNTKCCLHRDHGWIAGKG